MPDTQPKCSSPRRRHLSQVLVLLLTFCAPALLHAKDDAAAAPSDGARGMCGAMGTIEFTPPDWTGTPDHPNPAGPTTWWLDSEGIDPGTAGCHLGLTGPDGKLNGRLFGEACLKNGLLVESNPAAGEIHSHANDVGHPDTFDCNMWCQGKGFDTGQCVKVPAYPCRESAKCACSHDS